MLTVGAGQRNCEYRRSSSTNRFSQEMLEDAIVVLLVSGA